jgi:molybdopterin-containing oxidoreductase family membrane subunit
VKNEDAMNGKNSSRLVSYSVLTLLSFMGIVGVFWRMTGGLKVTSLTAFEPWGIWVVAYSFLIGVSGGCVLLSSLFTVFPLLVALISLTGGIVFIWLELGQPFKVFNLYLHPNWDTAMARLACFYPIFLISIAAGLYLWQKPEAQTSQISFRWVGVLSILFALLVNWDLGNVFSNHFTQHLWSKDLVSPVYLGLAVISGLAMGLVFLSLYEKKGDEILNLIGVLFKCLLFTVVFYIVFVFEEVTRSGSLNHILFGDPKLMFWVGQIGFLIVLPITFGWLGKKTRRVIFFGWAGLSTLAGVFVSRLYALIPATVAPELNGMETIYHGNRLAASGTWPNFLEISVILGLLALFVLAYLVLSEILGKRFSNQPLNK